MTTNSTQTLTRKQRKALERATRQAAQQTPEIIGLRKEFVAYCADHEDASLTLALKALDNHNHSKNEKDRDHWAEEAAYWSWYSDQAKDWKIWATNATNQSFNAWMSWIGLDKHTPFYYVAYDVKSHQWVERLP